MFDFAGMIVHHLADAPLGVLPGVSKHTFMLWLAAGLAASIVLAAAHGGGAFFRGLRVVMEMFIVFIRDDIVAPALGHDAPLFLPYFLTLFVFIFLMNVLGLIPWGATATGNISVTATLSLMTFVLIHGAGMWKHGPVHHVKNIVPPGVPWWVVPLVFAIELMGYVTKCLALCIRLLANMTAGHMVILMFLGLILMFGQSDPRAGLVVAPVSVGLALGLYMLELIVALIQAYVFTLLTAIFVGGALHPEH